jgi:hypothetical protein
MKFKSLALVVGLSSISLAIPAGAQTISTAAGSTTWGGAIDVAVDAGMYVADYLKHLFCDRPPGECYNDCGTGGGSLGDRGSPPRLSSMASVDPDGTFTSPIPGQRIRRIATNGITTYAGTGAGLPATAGRYQCHRLAAAGPRDRRQRQPVDRGLRQRSHPQGDAQHRRHLDVAGTGRRASTGDNGPPLADIDPVALAITADGSIYSRTAATAARSGPKVRKISADGTASQRLREAVLEDPRATVVPPVSASFLSIDGIALDSGKHWRV